MLKNDYDTGLSCCTSVFITEAPPLYEVSGGGSENGFCAWSARSTSSVGAGEYPPPGLIGLSRRGLNVCDAVDPVGKAGDISASGSSVGVCEYTPWGLIKSRTTVLSLGGEPAIEEFTKVSLAVLGLFPCNTLLSKLSLSLTVESGVLGLANPAATSEAPCTP